MKITRIARQPFTAVDTAWLHMDSPTNLAMICGVITFDLPLEFERLFKTLDERLSVYPRFRQRARQYRIGPPLWEIDKNYNLKNHLFRISLPDPADHITLQKMVSEMMSQPLDLSKPLWEIDYVENYGKGSALICRFHHCMADGIVLVQLLLSTADLVPDPQETGEVEDEINDLNPLAQLFVPVVKINRGLHKRYQSTRKSLAYGFDLITSPANIQSAALKGLAGAQALGKLLLIPPDPKTILKDKCGIPKKAVWTKSIQLRDVIEVGTATGATVNDVLMASITGALQKYLVYRGQDVDGLSIRAIVPVNLRSDTDLEELGNQFGLVFLSLPLDIADPTKRLTELKSRMDRIKETPEAGVAFGILNVMGISPSRIEDLIRNMFGKKGSVVITNVPGPNFPLYLAGGRINGLMFWVPTPVNLSIGISIISFDGDVSIGVATDEGLIPDPEKIIQFIQDEFHQIQSIYEKGETGTKPSAYPQTDGGILDNQTKLLLPDLEIERDPGLQSDSEPVEINLDQCKALTKKGKRCKNRPLPNSQFCKIHDRGAADES